LIIIFFTIGLSKPIFASEIVFQDDFSQGLVNWQPVRDDGQMWSVVDGKAEAYVSKRFTITELVLKNEIWNDEWLNLEYALDFTPLEGADKNISFKFNNLSNWYELHFVGGSCYLVKLKDGTIPFNYIASVPELTNGQTYNLKIQTITDRIVVFLNNEPVIDTVDYTYNKDGGRIGIKAGTGAAYPTRIQFDNIVVRTLDAEEGKQLNVPLQKQTDPSWKNAEYDHATNWDKEATTIGRWGCALSSASMILNYHGINKLIDGNSINPLTLNNWLASQADGFIDGVKSGYINWVAITRLTRELNEKYQTTKLETIRHAGEGLFQVAKNELANNKPSVLEIAGHFLVASGYTADQTDLYIKDPAYIFDLFSKHKTGIKSVRTFQPTHTDLSYLLLSHDPSVKLQLTLPDGSPINDLQTSQPSITDPADNSNRAMPSLIIHELAKPTNNQYLLQVSRENFGPFAFKFFSYDTQANFTDLSQAGFVGQEPITFMVNNDRNGISTLQQKMTLSQWRQQLKYLWKIKQIKKSYAFDAIDRIANLGEKQPATKQGRYVNNIRQLLAQYSNSMTAESKQFLEQQLRAIP
jgi:hypothetical protein